MRENSFKRIDLTRMLAASALLAPLLVAAALAPLLLAAHTPPPEAPLPAPEPPTVLVKFLTLDEWGNVLVNAPVEVLIDRAGDGPIPGITERCRRSIAVAPADVAVLCLKEVP